MDNLDITLIDEPEAFLHPPQMRRLGETLSSEVAGQLIVATHSSDILRGFLEGTKGNVRILRIHRDGDKNNVTEASAAQIKTLWEKPDLRYSNALEGIFHEQTIICEDDSDCKLINSVADHMELVSGNKWADTGYVPTGGKDAIPKIAAVLINIGVPVKAVFDMDFLSQRALVQSSIEAFGGSWEDIRIYWERINAAVQGGRVKSNKDIKSELLSLIGDPNEDELPKKKIEDILKQKNPWNEVKKYGIEGLPKGDIRQDFNRLSKILEDRGIFLVPVGEAESFCSEIGLHGPKFVTKLLSSVRLDDDRLINLRKFVEKVHTTTCNPQ